MILVFSKASYCKILSNLFALLLLLTKIIKKILLFAPSNFSFKNIRLGVSYFYLVFATEVSFYTWNLA